GTGDFRNALDRSNVAVPGTSLAPITAAWRFEGDINLVRQADGGVAGPRLHVSQRFGPSHGGLSMAAGRYLVIDLPVLEGVASVTPAKVHVYRAAPNWLRDPMAMGLLPKIFKAAVYTDVVRPVLDWSELTHDADDTLSTGSGERFIVD